MTKLGIKETLSVVIPCYNSEKTIPILMDLLIPALQQMCKSSIISDWEVVLVVDGPSDGTAHAAFQASKANPKIRSLELMRNFGQHNALIAGIRVASGGLIVTMDDDLQHLPSQINKLIQPLLNGEADLVYGVPVSEEHGFFRSFSSRSVKKLLEKLGVEGASYLGAFRAFKQELRIGFQEVQDSSAILDVLLSWTAKKIIAVEVEMQPRAHGRSAYTLRSLLRHSVNLITGYGITPLKVATLLGTLSGLLGFVFLLIQLVSYFTGNTNVEGFTTLVGLICLFSGIQLITIGIIGEYLGRLYFRSMNKPMYLIRNDSTK